MSLTIKACVSVLCGVYASVCAAMCAHEDVEKSEESTECLALPFSALFPRDRVWG